MRRPVLLVLATLACGTPGAGMVRAGDAPATLPLPTAAAIPQPAPYGWARVPPPLTPAVSDPLQRRGREVFWARCQACHGKLLQPAKPVLFNLPAMPGTVALQAKHQGAVPAELEERTDLTPEFIAYVVRRGSGHMPFFRPTELSRADLQALQAWLCRLR
ncbi:MAG: cytochrome c [Gammaproteobacteria bacterium]|nr:cytochrome c [Gammaproteobacteria bacterium]